MKEALLFGFVGCAVVGVLWTIRKTKEELRSRFGVFAKRFRPGEELKEGLLQFAREERVKAGIILSCVGSCQGAKIRLANADRDHPNEVRVLQGRFEILSLIGTLRDDGSCHLHVALGDCQGNVVGGHLIGDMPVFTTAEVVIGECRGLEWKRKFDDCTGFEELEVLKLSWRE